MKPYRYMADISSNNPQVDIGEYAKAGHCAIAIKATDGTGYTNPDHDQWAEEAHHHGLTVIHYHFCRPEQKSLDLEIEAFRHSYKKAFRNGDYTCFDLEVGKELGSPALKRYATSLFGRYATVSGRQAILYSYENYIRTNLIGVRIPGERWWVANYDWAEPQLEHPRTLWAWQYTDGVNGPEPHAYAGLQDCDGSILNNGVARRLWVRKLRTAR